MQQLWKDVGFFFQFFIFYFVQFVLSFIHLSIRRQLLKGYGGKEKFGGENVFFSSFFCRRWSSRVKMTSFFFHVYLEAAGLDGG